MPYIITIRTVVPYEPHRRASRVAVASDEAADYCEQIVAEHDLDVMPAIDPADIENGRTIGPLSDGTVIEVEQVTWEALDAEGDDGGHRFYPRDERARHAAILAAYNAAQGGQA